MKSLTLSQKLWGYAALCLLLIVGIIYYFFNTNFKTYREENEKLTSMIEIKQLALAKIRTQNQRKDRLEQEIIQANEEFQKHKEMFPDRDSIPMRLQDLTKVTRKSTVRPTVFKPETVVEKEFYMENSYEIHIDANYHSLGTFFEEIANLNYPTALHSVSIQGNISEKTANTPQHDAYTAKAQFKLVTFTSKN